MEQLWHSITAGAEPLIMSALAMLIPAAAAYALAWLKAQTALQEQAVRSAVDHVDALKEPAVNLDAASAKALAMRLVSERLAKVDPEKVAAQIERVVAAKRRASVPPADGSTP